MNKKTPDAISSKSPQIATPLEMNIFDAFQRVGSGEQITRTAWDNTKIYVFFGQAPGVTGEWLFIHIPSENSAGLKPGFHTWQISDSDWYATDYIVVDKGVVQ